MSASLGGGEVGWRRGRVRGGVGYDHVCLQGLRRPRVGEGVEGPGRARAGVGAPGEVPRPPVRRSPRCQQGSGQGPAATSAQKQERSYLRSEGHWRRSSGKGFKRVPRRSRDGRFPTPLFVHEPGEKFRGCIKGPPDLPWCYKKIRTFCILERFGV